MKQVILFLALLCPLGTAAQELYVSTEPASNMPANSLGFRVTSRFFKMEHEGTTAMRIEPEVMWGVTKKLMVHINAFASNQMQTSIEPEGAGIYAKYRFLSKDDVHTHFRMAAYVKGTVINNPFVPVDVPGMHYDKPYRNTDFDLDGGSSGVSGGLIATQLIHKLALSATGGYTRYLNNVKDNFPEGLPANAVTYSLSAGYLLLPRSYHSFEQTNLNLYVELLGKTNMNEQYIDIAPAIQFIFNSTTRLDLSYRTELTGNMQRNVFNTFLLRFEHNIFNVTKSKR
jgi:hypothetical protein